MTKKLMPVAVALLVAAACPVAWSAGWGAILRDSPIEDFSDEDLRQYLDVIKTALEAPESPQPPQPVTWRNAGSGAGGTLLVLDRMKVKDFEECRRVRTVVHSKRREGTPAVWTACKDSSGRWRLVSAD